MREISDMREAEQWKRMWHYGYVFSDDKETYEVDEEAAEIVKEIFSEFLQGTAYSKIATNLNERQIDCPKDHKGKLFGVDNAIQNGRKWNGDIVKNILKSEIYMGVCRKENNGEISVIAPEIISKEKFDLVHDIISSGCRVGRTGPKTTTFYEMIYDKSTGKMLQFCPYRGRKGGIFCAETASARLPDTEGKKSYICLNEILEAASVVLKRENELALNVWRHVESEENTKTEIPDKTQLQKEAQELFSELTDLCNERMERHIAHDNKEISEDLFSEKEQEFKKRSEEIEDQFWMIMEDSEGTKNEHIRENKWLKLYLTVDLPKTLGNKHIKKYIERVDVVNFEKIEITLKEEKWKEKLPKKWLTLEEEG